MGASPTPRIAERALHIAVATSGGRDSTALLHCVARAACGSGVQVHALHVHHGLMPEADDWVEHLHAQVRNWARRGLPVQLHVHRLTQKPAPGDSVEAWARRERYAALGAMAKSAGAGVVLLAHHRRDQAETVLLQALRGGGAAGLSAMPRAAQRQRILWQRPWLDQPSAAIDAYVKRYRLAFIEDPSNHDVRYARSRLRRQVWPALLQAFPDAETSLSASAARAQEGAACLAELAAMDMPACVFDGVLHVNAWLAFSPARRALLLRTWFSGRADGAVPQTLIDRLLGELATAATGRWPWPGGELRLYRGLLRVHEAAVRVQVLPSAVTLDLRKVGAYRVEGWPGVLKVMPSDGPGLLPADMTHAECRARSGGERFQFKPGSIPRSLKKQYQTAAVPAWQRDGPLVHVHRQLAFVPGLGLDARACRALQGQGLSLRWEPDGEPS